MNRWRNDPPVVRLLMRCPACEEEVSVPVYVTSIGTVGMRLDEVNLAAVVEHDDCRGAPRPNG